jgi:hypothetical protein
MAENESHPIDACRVLAGETCATHGSEYIIVEPICGGRRFFCAACLHEVVSGLPSGTLDFLEQRKRHWQTIGELREETARLERRFLDETKAHDKTRHVLECRERELERVRRNMYENRVKELMEHKPRKDARDDYLISKDGQWFSGANGFNCAYAYWKGDDVDEDESGEIKTLITGPYCGCAKASAPYGGGAGACDLETCEFWMLRDDNDHAEWEPDESDYPQDLALTESEKYNPGDCCAACGKEADGDGLVTLKSGDKICPDCVKELREEAERGDL